MPSSILASAGGGYPFPLTTDMIQSTAAFFGSIFGPYMTAYDALLTQHAPSLVAAVRGHVASVQHPFNKGLPLMDPIDMSFLVVLYFVVMIVALIVSKLLQVVAAGRGGKGEGGAVKKGPELRLFGILYNIVCVVMSVWLTTSLAWEAVQILPQLWGNPVDASHPRAEFFRNALFVFYMSKVVEFVDTYIMILKQNYRQLTFLHVYHHSSVLAVAYYVLVHAPGGDSYWVAMINSGIHVVMYTYYLLNLLFREGPIRKFLQKNKLILTFCQLTQFMLNVIHAVYVLVAFGNNDSGNGGSVASYPRTVLLVEIGYMATMLVLFGNFFVKNKQGGGGGKKDGNKKDRKIKKE